MVKAVFGILKKTWHVILIVTVILIAIALADSRKTATEAYNTGVDVGSWGLGTSMSGVGRFIKGTFSSMKANMEPSETEKALDKAKKAAEDQ